jgi:hypothetical protein
MTAEEKEQRVRRAREVLAGAGWLFDDFVNAEMRRVLASKPDERDAREEAYRRARVATELKIGLQGLIERYQADLKLQDRRDKMRGAPDGRRV